jgi:hypothetical protein
VKTRTLLVLLGALICSIAQAQNATTSRATKKLIEFGWDEPDTAFMREHIRQMEQTPFEGTVFHITYRKPDGGAGSFMNECWSARAFSDIELQPALDDLKATPFMRFTHNFLRFNVCPGDVNWFDDAAFAAVVNNARHAARIAHEGKARGILFDIEQYNAPLWTHASQKDAKTKSFDVYAAKVRQRGRELMQAFQDGYPGVTVLLTFAYSLNHQETGGDPSKLADTSYALLKPFLDGMLDAATPGVRIIDGFENSYGYKTREQFAEARRTMKETIFRLVADPQKYREHVSLAFGLWMDYDWRKHGWDVEHPERNYFTPTAFEQSTRLARDACDEYVWIYTETPKWWTKPDGKPEKLPQVYIDAVKRARD